MADREPEDSAPLDNPESDNPESDSVPRLDTAPHLDIAQLVVEHHAALYRYAYRLAGSSADAEDLTQQTFLTAQVKLQQLREPAHARAWLFSILRNCYLKSCRKWLPTPSSTLGASLAQMADELPHEELIDRERLQTALDELPADFKAVLLLFYFEGCSYREIAARLELPPGTVMSRLSRAKSHLRARLLEPECPTATGQGHGLSTRR